MFFTILYLLLAAEFSISLLTTLALPLAIVTAVFPSLPLGFSEQILKRRCDRWGYSRFHVVQRVANVVALLSTLCLAGFFLAWTLYEALPLWFVCFALVVVVVTLYSISFSGFYNLLGVAVLSFKLFLKEFDKKSDQADFGKLATAAKKISKIAEFYNMRVYPHQLSLGMTLAFLDDNEATRKDFDALIEWIENSTKQENFKMFRKLVKKYNSIAQKSAKEGIKEKHHWTFERIVRVVEVVVIPLSIVIIVYVVPKILEMLD